MAPIEVLVPADGLLNIRSQPSVVCVNSSALLNPELLAGVLLFIPMFPLLPCMKNACVDTSDAILKFTFDPESFIVTAPSKLVAAFIVNNSVLACSIVCGFVESVRLFIWRLPLSLVNSHPGEVLSSCMSRDGAELNRVRLSSVGFWFSGPSGPVGPVGPVGPAIPDFVVPSEVMIFMFISCYCCTLWDYNVVV